MTSTQTTLTGERADLVQTLDKHRGFFRYTVRELTDEQATTRTTASATASSSSSTSGGRAAPGASA